MSDSIYTWEESSMSILIKGMAMPESCSRCPMYNNCAGHYLNPLEGAGRGEHCPLALIPPHGDLISRSELDRSFTALRFNGNELAHWGDRKDWCLHGSEIENLINNAPTIIPAEEADDEH